MVVRFPKSIRRIVKFEEVEFPDLAELAVPELMSDTESEPEDAYDRTPSPSLVDEAYFSRPENDEGEIDTSDGLPPMNVLIDLGDSSTEDSEVEDDDEEDPAVPPWASPERICMDGVKSVGLEANASNLGWMAAALVNHCLSIRRPNDAALRLTRCKVIWQLCKLSEIGMRQEFLPVFDADFDEEDYDEDVWAESSIKIMKIAVETWGRTLAQLVNYLWHKSEDWEYIELEDLVVCLSLKLRIDPCDLKAICAFYWQLSKFLSQRCVDRLIEMEEYDAECEEVKVKEKMYRHVMDIWRAGVEYGLIDPDEDW